MQRLFILQSSNPSCVVKGIPSKKRKVSYMIRKHTARNMIIKHELQSLALPDNSYLTLYLRTPKSIYQITVDKNITSALDIIKWFSYYIYVPPSFIQLYHRKQIWKCCEYLDVFLKKTNTNTKNVILQYKTMDFPSNPWWSTHHIHVKGFSEQKSSLLNIFPHSHDIDCKDMKEQPFNIIHSISRYTTTINWTFYLVKGCASPTTISLENIILKNEYGYVVPLDISYNVDKAKVVNVTFLLRKSLSQGKYILFFNPLYLKSSEKISIYRTTKRVVFPTTMIKFVVA